MGVASSTCPCCTNSQGNGISECICEDCLNAIDKANPKWWRTNFGRIPGSFVCAGHNCKNSVSEFSPYAFCTKCAKGYVGCHGQGAVTEPCTTCKDRIDGLYPQWWRKEVKIGSVNNFRGNLDCGVAHRGHFACPGLKCGKNRKRFSPYQLCRACGLVGYETKTEEDNPAKDIATAVVGTVIGAGLELALEF